VVTDDGLELANGERISGSQAANPPRSPLGRTSATERDASTSDKFSFWLAPNVIVNPFDIVEVEQVSPPGQEPSKTYGLVTILEHQYHFGKTWREFENWLEAQGFTSQNPPDEIWISAVMTYWWESIRDLAARLKNILIPVRRSF